MIAIADDPTRFPLSEPTPMEIALRCADIRARWSEDERYRRSTHFAGTIFAPLEHRGIETRVVPTAELAWVENNHA